MTIFSPKKNKTPLTRSEQILTDVQENTQKRAEEIKRRQRLQTADEERIKEEQYNQQYLSPEDNLPLSNLRDKRKNEQDQKQNTSNYTRQYKQESKKKEREKNPAADKYMRQHGTSGAKNNQPSLTASRGSDRKPNGEKMSREERFREIMKKRQEEELKKKIKQRAAQIAKQATQKAAQIAVQVGRIIVQGLAQATIWLGGATIAAIGIPGLIALVVIFIVVIVIVVIYQTCNDNAINSTICQGVSWVGGAISWIGGWLPH